MAQYKSKFVGKSEAYWTQFALSRFGCTPQQLFGFFCDFDDGSQLAAPTVTGTQALLGSPALDGAWASWSVGDGTASGRVQLRKALIAGVQVPIHFANMKTSKWMMVGRYKLTTAAGATARATLANGSANVIAGIAKATHATKFVGLPGSGPIVSTVSIDTNTHEVMFRNDPPSSLAFLSVDGESEVSGSNAGIPGTADQFEFDLFTGALEAQQILQIDYFGVFSVRS